MTRFVARLLALLVLAAGAGCSTTSFNTTWKDSGSVLTLKPGDPVVAMVVSPNESTRRGAEYALAAELRKRGLNGIPAYSIVPTKDVLDVDTARARIRESGARAVVVMRVIGADKEVHSSPGTYLGPHYGLFYGGYYGRGWGAAHSPGYLTTDTIVSVETLVYDLTTDKLVWAGQSRTLNPDDAEAFVAELVDEVGKEMKKQGVLLGSEP